MTDFADTSDAVATRLSEALGADYRLERELTAGGMGRVYLYWQTSLNRRVVAKVVADSARVVDVTRFRQEILLSAGLQHPHIVPLLAAGDLDGLPYFTMPFVDGSTLRTLLDAGAITRPGEINRILRDIATALCYAHARGVVHRDLKPENVMLASGSVIVLDFGVAKAMSGSVGDGRRITGVGYTVGTPGYMAPEQVAGDPSLDHRADLYAFGVLAFELCTGAPLFRGSPSEIIRQHLATAPPDLAIIRRDLPSTLTTVVRACLQKNPDDRPADATVVLDMLDGTHPSLLTAPAAGSASPSLNAHSRGARFAAAAKRPTVLIPALYAGVAMPLVLYLLHLAQTEQLREGIAAAGVVGALLGLPLALASGVLIRVVGAERRHTG